MVSIFSFLLLLTGDPLFQKMQGHWIGQGTRSYLISGRESQVEVEVVTSFQQIRGKLALVSQNSVTEKNQDLAPKSYSTVYWVRPSDTQPGQYELGAMGSDQADASGWVDRQGGFWVEQTLMGGDNPYVVLSDTQFSPDQAVYTDTFKVGAVIQSKSRIEYRRVTP